MINVNIAIGDIHGKNCWKDLLDCDFNNAYFVGDYFDNYENTPAVTQIRNFKEICEVARKDNRIHLCLGNHDLHYLRGIPKHEQYSGFQWYSRFDIQEALEENINFLNVVCVYNDTLISHAGVSRTFLLENNITLETLNDKFKENRNILTFNNSCYDPYGDDPISSPVWIRPKSLLKDCVDGYKQIVGHTKVLEIETRENITFIDCLDSVVKSYKFT